MDLQTSKWGTRNGLQAPDPREQRVHEGDAVSDACVVAQEQGAAAPRAISSATSNSDASTASLRSEGIDMSENSSTATFYLGVFDDHLRGVPVHDGTILIGRSKNNHLQLHDHLLSRKHCSLHRHGDRLTLVDLNSSNGTYVNGERISSRQLKLDDIVELGKTVLVVYDGESWGRGQGLMNLRDPLKAQELVQRLGDQGLPKVEPNKLRGKGDKAAKNGAQNGVRARKGLIPEERVFLDWLAQREDRLLPQLVTEYLTHKLVSLLVRNSKSVRSAFTVVLEEMMRPEFFERFEETGELRETIAELVHQELGDLRSGEAAALEDRGLLEEPGERPGSAAENGTEAGQDKSQPATPDGGLESARGSAGGGEL